MVHRTQITNDIWTQEFVYRNSLTGKSEDFLVERVSSLQQGFDSDSQRGFPIAIHDLTTFFAFEQGIVGTVSVPNSTAVRTPFGSVPTIDYAQSNVVIEAPLLKNLSELIKRNTHNGSVEPFAFGLESLKLLDGNIGVESGSDFNNFSDNLTEICFDKISFLMLQYFKFLNSIQRLKQCSPFHNLLSLYPDMLPKISLIQNFSLWGNHTDSKMFGIDIDSKDVLSLLDVLFLGKIGNNLQIRSQPKSFTYPTILNQVLKSLVVPILLDGNWNGLPWKDSKLDEEISLSFKSPAVSGNVKLDSQTINLIGFLSPNLSFQITDNLRVEGGILLDN
jgi:hypothetical protein